jgi:hypothetical protein
MDTGAGPARPLQVVLNPGGLLFVEDKDENTVLPVAVIFLNKYKEGTGTVQH